METPSAKSLKLKIDKGGDIPAYRQIIEQVTTLVRDGRLVSGDRLPPERELASELGLARGTVKTAYEKLASSDIVEISQGRGTFVSSGQYVMAEGRKAEAVRIIGEAISALERLKFGAREMSSMFQILLAEQEERKSRVHIAGVDCNPEALSVFDRQLRYISKVQMSHFLLDDVSHDQGLKGRLGEFDLIITTATHYAELLGLFPEFRDKIVKAAVSPSQQTIIDLARIPASAKVGIIARSKNFLKIIRGKLGEFQLDMKGVRSLLDGDLEKAQDFIRSRDVLVTPPDCALEDRKDVQFQLRKFREGGGSIIPFDYQIERGSLSQIEERISEIIQNMKSR